MDIKLAEMTPAQIADLNALELLDGELLLQLYEIKNSAEQARLRSSLLVQAKMLGVKRELQAVLQKYDMEQDQIDKEYRGDDVNYTEFSFQRDSLFCGKWIADDDGVRRYKQDDTLQWASPIPVIPTALLENISTGTEKVQLDFVKSSRQRSLICERSTTASSTKIISLADKGLEVNSENAKYLVQYISDVISRNFKKIPYLEAVSNLGWNKYGFMPYTKDIVFDGERENRHLFHAVCEKGMFEHWRDITQELRKNDTLRIMMDASFASALIEKLSALPFVFHLWGKTGGGKTVSLCLAMSIWGDPRLGKLVRTMNMTQNSMLSTAAFLNSIPFAGDELQTIKSRWDSYDQLIMRVTEGIDRGRMTYDKNNETKTWRCSFLFTGEEPCVKPSSGGGVVNRVLSFENTEDLFTAESGSTVMALLSEHHGHAGKIFTDYIGTQDDLTERFRRLTIEVRSLTGTTDKQASSMAMILLADQLAGECIYTDEKPLDPAISALFVKNEKQVDVSERAYEFTMDTIAKNIRKFTDDYDYNGEIWGTRGDGFVMFNATVLRRILSDESFDFDAVKKSWADKKYIVPDSRGKYAHSTKCHGIKSQYIKFIISKQFDDLDEEVPF